MKPNLDEEDIIIICFCLGYAMASAPVRKEKIIEVMKKLAKPLMAKTRREVKKELK